MIYYWCPDYSTPVGGVRVMYRHVDVLNENGFEAAILHRRRKFRCTWFENDTKVLSASKAKISAEDYLVVPENYGSLYVSPAQRPKAAKFFNSLFSGTPAKKVIFNQNTYNTFHGHDFTASNIKSLYLDKDIQGVMVVSQDNRDYLHMAYPGLKVFRVHNSIDQKKFAYQAEKKPIISFMPRKNADHALQVINMLKFGGHLNEFTVKPIQGCTEKETADILRESLIFLSFGYPEGFSLPPAEAMSCGCIAVGYHGMGGREYFKKEHCFPVEMGDITSFAKTIIEVMRLNTQSPQSLRDMGRKASIFIQENYSIKRERADILDIWTALSDGIR